MAKKKIHIIGAGARKKIIAGVDRIADAVKLTHGPFGRNFASGVRGGAIAISNDGVSLAKEIQGADEFEDVGVRAVREAATKTNDKAGDGTTTAVVLTQAILKVFGMDEETVGWNSTKVAKQVETESKVVVDELQKMATPIQSEEEIIAVARVSVEDEAAAELIGKAQWRVGASGTVLVEEHNDVTDTVEYIYGVRVDNGFGTSRIANNAEKQALELKDTRIIVTNKVFNKAKDVTDMTSLFEDLIKEGVTSVILVAKAFDETAIGVCVNNIQGHLSGKGGFPIYPINAPYMDHNEIMEDLAAATGAKFINTTERNVASITPKDVGIASKLFCTRYEGIITGPARGTDPRIDALVDGRLSNIEEKLAGQISPFEKRQLEARRAQLTAGTAIIKVGAETEQERRYKKDKFDDAVNAVKAAMESGVVPGAGLALKQIADLHPDLLIADALREPNRQIVKNAGGVLDIPAWVRDPLKIVRTAFEKASSIARTLATTEVIVTNEDEKPMYAQMHNTAPNDEE